MRGRGLGSAHAAAAVVLGAGAPSTRQSPRRRRDGRPARGAVPFTGYLLLSVLAVPVGWSYARWLRRGWDAATFALVDGRARVICVRLGRTWG